MFRYYAGDTRFPGIEVRNCGSIKFEVVKGDTVIDSFTRIETPLSTQVSIDFAVNESAEFFAKLNTSQTLQRFYSVLGSK